MLAMPPQPSDADQNKGMGYEKKGMEPMFLAFALFAMDEFIFRDEQAGDRPEHNKREQGAFAEGKDKNIGEAKNHAECIERVSDPFPKRQAALDVKEKFVEQDHCRLHKKWNIKKPLLFHDTFSSKSPLMVSPGPNAIPATTLPEGYSGSLRISSQICGRVAEDILPRV